MAVQSLHSPHYHFGGGFAVKVVFPTCCGVDVHKTFVVATIITTPAGSLQPNYRKKRFSTFNSDLNRFANWLLEHDCLDVCMESTGKYWVPVFNILEKRGIRVVIANPKWVKAVKGNKDDTKDSKWIGDLFRIGLVKSSFIPDLDIRILEMQTAPTTKALLNGEIDAAIIANQPTEVQLQGDILYYEQFYAYVARNESVFKKEMVRSADISDERLWLLDEGHCFRDQLMRFCQMEKVKLRQAAYRLGSLETFMRMVESGNGVTFIPELATYQLSEQQKELVRPFAIPKPAREIVWVTRKDFIRHSVAGILIESIRKSVPKEMRTLQAGLRVV